MENQTWTCFLKPYSYLDQIRTHDPQLVSYKLGLKNKRELVSPWLSFELRPYWNLGQLSPKLKSTKQSTINVHWHFGITKNSIKN